MCRNEDDFRVRGVGVTGTDDVVADVVLAGELEVELEGPAMGSGVPFVSTGEFVGDIVRVCTGGEVGAGIDAGSGA